MERQWSGCRAVILHGEVPPGAPPDEQDTLVQVEAVRGWLAALGVEGVPLAMGLDLDRALAALRAEAPDLVFNLVESVRGDGRLVHLAPALLEHAGLPFTGCGTDAMVLTTDKVWTKRWLAAAGLPTPPWFPLRALGTEAPPFPGPYILKPVAEDASVGLDDHSVAADLSALLGVVAAHRAGRGGPAFVERFVDGREFNVALLEDRGVPTVLPPSEILFHGFPPGKPRLVGYRAKWDEASFEYQATRRTFDHGPEDAALLARLRDLSARAWDLLGLRGYARVDFRVDERGEPVILEVNANPCISPDAGFVAACAHAGLPPEVAVGRIVEAALRGRTPLPARRGWERAVAQAARRLPRVAFGGGLALPGQPRPALP